MSLAQAFHKGDHVMIAKDLGPYMSHFKSDCEAIVIGSYADQYGGSDRESYTVHIKGYGKTSWYDGHQLSIIRYAAHDLLEKWEREEAEEIARGSNLDWIFENGPSIVKKSKGATVSALAKCLGVNDLWGPNGEGYTYYQNARIVMAIAYPFLILKDRHSWSILCDSFTGRYRRARAIYARLEPYGA